MTVSAPIFNQDIFRFFRELARNNNKPWMDENRDRYQSAVVEPFRLLLDRLTPFALRLNPQFVVSGRVGQNFSRINRDIRFAKDKSPYRPQMYLFFAEPGEGGQLYVGLSAEAVTCGFRAYRQSRTSPLATLSGERARTYSGYIDKQRRKFSRRFDSYWYASEKGEWTKHRGWPSAPENWKKLQGWIVRKKVARSAATQAGFERQIAAIFRELYPVYSFTTSRDWNSNR